MKPLVLVLAMTACSPSAPPPAKEAPVAAADAAAVPPSAEVPAPASAEVRIRIREKLPDVEACYQAALASKPGLVGRMVVALAIEADGRVSTAEASGVDPGVESCAEEIFRAMQFSPAEGQQRVEYPIDFQPAAP